MVCDAADRLQVTIIVTWGNFFFFQNMLTSSSKILSYDITEIFFRYKVYYKYDKTCTALHIFASF